MPLSYYALASQRRLDLIDRSLADLGAGRLYAAYALADMSCTGRPAAAEDLLLRGEIAGRLGFAALERADVEAAFSIDPSLASVQLRVLALLRQSDEVESADAIARAVLRLDPQPAVLRAAIAALKPASGCGGRAWSTVSAMGLRINIVSAVPRNFAIEVSFERHGQHLQLQSATTHAMASILGAAGSVEIGWPKGARTARFSSEPALDWVGAPAFKPFHQALPVRPRQRRTRLRPSAVVTLIMPVHADIERTRAAIDSALLSQSILQQRLVLVDDCGSDLALRAMLATYAQRPGVALIVNPINLGFIGSVNRALQDYPDGDVVLLNADTIVAPGWLERLSQAAYSRAGLGTATPLSNNGELTSVPAAFAMTPMPAAAEVAAIDRAASVLHARRTIDLPNGVGFCLYITEACRQAVGLLNDVDFREGYLEDVDYCLRASELGFSHVCACDVFVGHAGSSSFQARKRGLVMHNLARLERRFPGVSALTRHFMQADPLRSVRLALQRQLLKGEIAQAGPVTLVIGRQAMTLEGGRDYPTVAELAKVDSLLKVSFSACGEGFGAILHRDGAMAPHQLPIEFASDDPLAELGSGLVDQSQKMTAAAMQIAEKNVWAQRS